MNAIPLFGTESRLPSRVGTLDLEDIEYYPDPKLGVKIRYGTPTTAKADAYLYNMGLSHLPESIQSPQLVEWFQEACQGVVIAAERGLYRDLEVLKSQYLFLPVDAPEPFCLWASFAYKQAAGPGVAFGGRRVSNLSLRTDLGFINKVRYTCPEDGDEAGVAGFVNFLVEWTCNLHQACTEP